MTRHRSFKRLVRARMDKTGESYTAARAMLLAAEDRAASERPPLATSDEKIRERTGRGWEEWFDRLDEWGATERPHREIARWVAEQLAIEPLAWNAQAIAWSYERTRGLREAGEREDGFAITTQKTVAIAAERLFDAFVDEDARARWLPNWRLRERTATKPRSARFDWAGGETRVNVVFESKGEAKHCGRRARATGRCRPGRANEGLLARGSECAQDPARGVRSMPDVALRPILAATIVAFVLGAAPYAPLGRPAGRGQRGGRRGGATAALEDRRRSCAA